MQMSRQRAQEELQRWAPARFVRLPTDAAPKSVAVACVYRARNAQLVADLIADLPGDWPVRLWALDDVDDGLAHLTIGRGPGGRTMLLNTLVASLPSQPEMLVLMDDDVRFAVGGLPRLLRAGSALDFDLFQPAHSATSHWAFRFVRKRPLLFARETTFVEQGPMVVMSRRAQRTLLPLPEELVMGWGIEVRWNRIAREARLRLGIVDAIAIHHKHPETSGHAYDSSAELAHLRQELASAGLDNLAEIQTSVREFGPLGTFTGPSAPWWRMHHRGAH